MTCERPGCTLDAAYRRWRADPNSQGANLNEPGIRAELLCIAHKNEVVTYLGTWGIEPLPERPENP